MLAALQPDNLHMTNILDKDEKIAALETELSALKTILAMMPGHLYWRNTEGYYLGCNTNIANLLNYSSTEQLIGKRAIEFLPPHLATQIDEIDLEVIRTKQEKTLEEPGTNILGQPAIYLTRKSPFLGRNGEVKGVLGISFDITERKKMEAKLIKAKEKAEAASRAKSQFLAMISHELRTPLTSILGFAKFINQDKLEEHTRQEYTTHIINSGGYLLSLINSLLDYNKLENNKFEVVNLPLNLKDIVISVTNMLGSSAKLKNLPLILNFDESIPELLMVDDKIFQQILINLVGNAIKFTEDGRVTINVKLLEKTDESVKLSIAVEDTGVGIPVEEQTAIFRKFYQLESIYTRNESLTGTGLGLAIVKKLVGLLRSKIKVVSTPGIGSTFSFTSRLSIPTADDLLLYAPQDEDNNNTTQNDAQNKPYILLTEDDQLVQIIHRHVLMDLGCNVDVAATAAKTLEKVEQNYDLLFVDIGLPDMAGFELIKEIRLLNDRLAKVPIVVLTGYSDDKEIKKCLAAGADEVAIKPVSSEVLKEILNRMLKQPA
jgi:two-component system aerobic respiration control sensor histidine kinase ArcB